jgi:predicted RNase H-like HicB family nuclease
MTKSFEIELELEEDGRWIAAIENLPGVLAYGSTAEEARSKAKALALEVALEKAPRQGESPHGSQ